MHGTVPASLAPRDGGAGRDGSEDRSRLFLPLADHRSTRRRRHLESNDARTCFRLSAVLGLVGGLILMFGGSSLAVAGVVAAGLGFANIWPMLFSITVEEEPERASELSGLMCMAISGGAIVPLLMGGLVDAGFKTWAFVVPAACFAYLTVLALRGGGQSAAASP